MEASKKQKAVDIDKLMVQVVGERGNISKQTQYEPRRRASYGSPRSRRMQARKRELGRRSACAIEPGRSQFKRTCLGPGPSACRLH